MKIGSADESRIISKGIARVSSLKREVEESVEGNKREELKVVRCAVRHSPQRYLLLYLLAPSSLLHRILLILLL
jgi:hypothetical protein